MLETKIESAFVSATAKLGGWALKFTSPGNAGVPDRLALLPCGCSRLVELKAPGERPRPLQVRTFERMAALGHPVEVLDTLDAVRDWAARHDEHITACTTPRKVVM